MARFTLSRGLEERLAARVADHVTSIARKVEDEAKDLAPPTKIWRTKRDTLVRHQHALADDQEVAENLRFKLESFDWDREHRGLGPYTYLLVPRDPTSRAYVNTVNCRCRTLPGTGVADGITLEAARVTGTRVEARVVSASEWAVDAEYGTTYPGGQGYSPGVRYMGRAVEHVAATS